MVYELRNKYFVARGKAMEQWRELHLEDQTAEIVEHEVEAHPDTIDALINSFEWIEWNTAQIDLIDNPSMPANAMAFLIGPRRSPQGGGGPSTRNGVPFP